VTQKGALIAWLCQ